MKSKFSVKWTEIALFDLEEIVDYIEYESPKNAKHAFAKIKSEVIKLDFLPLRGRIVPEFEEQGLVLFREVVIPPWRIVYRVSEHNVLILGLIDSRKNVEDILLNRFLRGQRARV